MRSEQEHARTYSSSNLDDRTMHEVYAHPFLRSVMAGVASVMCSYSVSLLVICLWQVNMTDEVSRPG